MWKIELMMCLYLICLCVAKSITKQRNPAFVKKGYEKIPSLGTHIGLKNLLNATLNFQQAPLNHFQIAQLEAFTTPLNIDQ